MTDSQLFYWWKKLCSVFTCLSFPNSFCDPCVRYVYRWSCSTVPEVRKWSHITAACATMHYGSQIFGSYFQNSHSHLCMFLKGYVGDISMYGPKWLIFIYPANMAKVLQANSITMLIPRGISVSSVIKILLSDGLKSSTDLILLKYTLVGFQKQLQQLVFLI